MIHWMRRMHQSARHPGALAPRLHTHRMLACNAQWHGGRYLCHSLLFGQLRDYGVRHLRHITPSGTPLSVFCSAFLHSSAHSIWLQNSQASAASAAACSVTSPRQASCRAPAAIASLSFEGMHSGRAFTSTSFQGLEPAAFSAQHGLRRSVRLKAVSEKGHCGEDGLVKGAGVVRSLPVLRQTFIHAFMDY